MQEVEDDNLVAGLSEHEENNKARSEKQIVQDNDFVVNVTKGEHEKEADPVMQEV